MLNSKKIDFIQAIVKKMGGVILLDGDPIYNTDNNKIQSLNIYDVTVDVEVDLESNEYYEPYENLEDIIIDKLYVRVLTLNKHQIVNTSNNKSLLEQYETFLGNLQRKMQSLKYKTKHTSAYNFEDIINVYGQGIESINGKITEIHWGFTKPFMNEKGDFFALHEVDMKQLCTAIDKISLDSYFGWSLTDGSLGQFGIQLSENKFQFREFNRNNFDLPKDGNVLKFFNQPKYWIDEIIDLKNYTESEIEDHISGYYDSVEAMKTELGKDLNWIIAECIFEVESELY